MLSLSELSAIWVRVFVNLARIFCKLNSMRRPTSRNNVSMVREPGPKWDARSKCDAEYCRRVAVTAVKNQNKFSPTIACARCRPHVMYAIRGIVLARECTCAVRRVPILHCVDVQVKSRMFIVYSPRSHSIRTRDDCFLDSAKTKDSHFMTRNKMNRNTNGIHIEMFARKLMAEILIV